MNPDFVGVCSGLSKSTIAWLIFEHAKMRDKQIKRAAFCLEREASWPNANTREWSQPPWVVRKFRPLYSDARELKYDAARALAPEHLSKGDDGG